MSFILDALRKSEHDRQDRTGPDLAHVRVAHDGEGIPRWVVILGALLTLNLVVIVTVSLWNRDEPPTTAQSPQPSPERSAAAPYEAPSPAAAPVRQSPSPTPTAATPPQRNPASAAPAGQRAAAATDPRGEVRPLRDEAGTRPTTPAAAPAAEATGRPAPGSVIYEDTELAANDATESEGTAGDLPGINDVRARGVDVPDVNVEIHVYDTVAANRFVFINMSKYSEGDRLKEGPIVDEITPDGVILRHQGERFLLPRN